MEKEKPGEICKVDVLYIIGNGSINNNAELLYSLRMLSANASNVGRVIVCGDVPKFVGGEADCRFLKDVDALRCALECAPDDADLLLLDSFGAARSQEAFINERRNAIRGWAKVSAARSAAAYIVGKRYINRLISLGERCTRGKKARIFDQWFENRWLDGANIYCAVPNLAVQAVDPTAANRPSAASNHNKYMEMGIDMEQYASW